MQTVRCLAAGIGPRPAGSAAERHAAECVAETLSDMGLSAEIRTFVFRGWRPSGNAELDLCRPGQLPMRISGPALPYTASTPEGGVTGRLVWQGEWPLIPGRLCCSRYVVVDGDDQPQAAVIVYPSGEARPLPNTLPLVVLPTICIGSDDGLRLRQALAITGTPVSVSVRCPDIWEGPLRSRNVICSVGPTDRMLTVSAHLDSVAASAGANDNASGVAAVLRLARLGRTLLRGRIGLRFAFYGAEEPLFIGSRVDVMELATTGRLAAIIGCLNLDMIAVGDRFSLRCSEASLWSTSVGHRRDWPGHAVVEVAPPAAASDHWAFHEAGVDSAQLTRGPDHAYHTPADVLERIDPASLEIAEEVAFETLSAVIESAG